MESFNKPQLTMEKESAIEKLNLLALGDNQQTAVADTASVNSFTSLPVHILFEIFDICALKEQLVLTKVCKHFCQLLSEMLSRKYQHFIYNCLNFKFSLGLDDEQISQLCRLSGQNVTHLRFGTPLNSELVDCISRSQPHMSLDKMVLFINDNFQQNLKYFPNLLELEIQCQFVLEPTFSELAKRCCKLTTIRLLDGYNCWHLGKHLADFKSIEHLELISCRNLEAKQFNAVAGKRPLKTLNIVECEDLKNVPIMVKLCQTWQHLETLRLTAFTQDANFIKAVLSLPMLKCLEFFSLNIMPLQFEENFFAELKDNTQKSICLKSLKFENNRYHLEDESQKRWTDTTYALMRENVCIYGQLWQWTDKMFENISKALESFTHLQSIDFHYCRLLSHDQLQQLPEINKNLKLITIFGCPRKEDEWFNKQWLETGTAQCGANCQLKFESVLNFKEISKLQFDVATSQSVSYYKRKPVMRSIECQFSKGEP